ncbi:PREDICTED: protein MEI2-like 4 isoform X2 [Lupinus angustifolius]|uniref:protein MEI2-like 4 isoform X2 n=1 Tax=Lupinus angustifolius TaxID=3871 RepID=UPI00092FBB50|nr:PREDICTED: protein MEI2-like 4 isoform X2 [Lupinus angustifolius]
MPSEIMGFKSLSSLPFSSEDIWSSTERHAGLWKSNKPGNCYGSGQGSRPSLDVKPVSKFSESRDVNIISTKDESNLFSSSLSELFRKKLGLSADNALYGHSVDTFASHYEEDKLFDSLEELEAQTIGNLLPSDDDLLSGLTDGLEQIIEDSTSDDMDELDIFSSVGGMELGDSNQPVDSKSIRQIHPELKQKDSDLYLHQSYPPLKSSTSFPDLHGVSKSGSMHNGRMPSVESAMHEPSMETAFTHGLSSSVPNTLPSQVKVKSIDSRCGINEYSIPGPLNLDIRAASAFHPPSPPECDDNLANGVHYNPTEMRVNANLKTRGRTDNMQFCQVNSNAHSMQFNEGGNSKHALITFKSPGNGCCRIPDHRCEWSNSYQPPATMFPNSPPYFDGLCSAPTLPRLHGHPMSPSHMMNQHVLSAPAVNSPIWDRRHIYAAESPSEAYAFHPGSLGSMRFCSNTPQFVDFVSHDIFPHFGGNCVDLQIPPRNVGLQFHNQRDLMFPRRNHMIPIINQFNTHKERVRSRRNEGEPNLADKKQYELDIDRIKCGEDNRTTLMIKNIPNKYTSKMLLAAIDERHKGTYDFVYLPIDFKNKCNVGYAFINMINPSMIIPFYQVFNGKKWEKFNSEKVALLAYARIQGKEALISHFQNSSLMNEDKRCRPILFNTEGPNAGVEVPFPTGVNIRDRHGRVRNNTTDNMQGSLPNLVNCELSSADDCNSKESD